MITGFFLAIGLSVLEFFVGFLPVTEFPAAITSAVATVMGYVNAMSFLVPVATILQVLAIAMTFHAILFLWRFAHLIGRYLRGR